MAFKKKMAAALAALVITSAGSVAAYAESGNYTITAKIGEPDTIPKPQACKKEDDLRAWVDATSGIPTGFYVTFRVKEFDGSDASEVAYATQNNTPYRMSYLDDHGEIGQTYRLSAWLDSNPVVTSTKVSGRWEP